MSRSAEDEWLFYAQMRADPRFERRIRAIIEDIRRVERRYGALVGPSARTAATASNALTKRLPKRAKL